MKGRTLWTPCRSRTEAPKETRCSSGASRRRWDITTLTSPTSGRWRSGSWFGGRKLRGGFKESLLVFISALHRSWKHNVKKITSIKVQMHQKNDYFIVRFHLLKFRAQNVCRWLALPPPRPRCARLVTINLSSNEWRLTSLGAKSHHHHFSQ